MNKKLVIPLVLVVVIAGSVTYFYAHQIAQQPAAHSLKISGNIEAHESVVGFKVQGRLMELSVQEGQDVKEGDLLATLDQNDYRQQVTIDEATVHWREAELALALAGSRKQEIRAAEQAMLDTRADLELKKIESQRNQTLFEKDEVSAEKRDISATNLKRAQAAYERNKQAYDQVREGTRKEQITVSQANARVANQNLQMAKIRLGYTLLRAPMSGVVVVRQAERGEVMAPGTPVVTIADLDHLWLRGYIGETDLGRVHLGQTAIVKTDTFPGKAYTGRVSFISAKAEFTPKSVETHKERVTLVYRIKIDLDNPGHELKPGMPADGEFAAAIRH